MNTNTDLLKIVINCVIKKIFVHYEIAKLSNSHRGVKFAPLQTWQKPCPVQHYTTLFRLKMQLSVPNSQSVNITCF